MALTGDIFKSSPESKQKAEDNSVGVVKEVPILTEEVLADHNKTTKNHDADKCGDAVRSEPPDDSRSQIGAGVLAGITGLFLGGPILGAISGASAYYVASNNDGPIGDAARNTGDWAVKTGAKVGETVREADERHNIFDRVQNFFSNGWQRVCQLDQEHKASERVKETVSEVGAKTIEFERNHHFMENILVGIQKGIDFVLEKLKGATNNENSNAHCTNS